MNKKMKLFLTSAGFVPETTKSFLELLDKDPKDVTAAFIPTAAGPEKNKIYIKLAIDQIKKLGMKVKMIDLVDENEQSLYKKLFECDVIVVNGGNTFYLLDWAKRSGFDKVILKLLDQGKIYVGISAGSYITCPTIEAAKWKHLDDPDVVGKTNLTALNLVNFLIIAHYEDKYKKDVENGAKTTNLPVVALTDKQAIVVNSNQIKIVGQKNTFSLNGFVYNHNERNL